MHGTSEPCHKKIGIKPAHCTPILTSSMHMHAHTCMHTCTHMHAHAPWRIRQKVCAHKSHGKATWLSKSTGHQSEQGHTCTHMHAHALTPRQTVCTNKNHGKATWPNDWTHWTSVRARQHTHQHSYTQMGIQATSINPGRTPTPHTRQLGQGYNKITIRGNKRTSLLNELLLKY